MPFLERLARWFLEAKPSDRLGARGEREAERFLRRKGYRIVERNWRCDGGEVDLIARDGQWLVFLEVKTRRGEHVRPEDQIHSFKEGRLRHAADVYLTRYRGNPPPVRFDVVAIVWPAEDAPPVIRHEAHAFD